MSRKEKDLCYYMGWCIRQLRNDRRYNRAELADKADLSLYKLSQIENGKKIHLVELDAVIKALNVTNQEYMEKVKRAYERHYDEKERLSQGNIVSDEASELYQYMLNRIQEICDNSIDKSDVVFTYYIWFFERGIDGDIYPLTEEEIDIIRAARRMNSDYHRYILYKCFYKFIDVFKDF